jgi:hypothetical protein
MAWETDMKTWAGILLIVIVVVAAVGLRGTARPIERKTGVPMGGRLEKGDRDADAVRRTTPRPAIGIALHGTRRAAI